MLATWLRLTVLVMLKHLVGHLNLSNLEFLVGLSYHPDRDLCGLRDESLHGKFRELAQRHPDLRPSLHASLCFGDVNERSWGPFKGAYHHGVPIQRA